MARIIIQKTKPECIRTTLLPALGRLKDFSIDDNAEFRCDFLYENSVIYVIEVHIKGADCILDLTPIQIIQNNKECYLSEVLSKKESVKLVESLYNALTKYCKENNLNYIVFPKHDFYDAVLSSTTKLAKELIKICILEDKILKQIPALVEGKYDCSVIYSPIGKTFYSSQNLVYPLVKDVTVFEDYYEFFCDLGDESIKAGYEVLIKKILYLAGISKKNYNVEWEGKFDNENWDVGPKMVLSYGSTTSNFNLKYLGERVDTKDLLKGLNSFIKARFPDEKRELQMLQIFNDQTGCVWFVTEKQLWQLCPIIHAGWEDFPDHCCEVTRVKALKEKGPRAELELCKKSAEREWKRLSNLEWRVYPAKKQIRENNSTT